ncbi:MAG: TerB family tellurite resistance protein [Cytophagales bacterium]|tara:strand:- start:17 stop:430 length:414 start_codon:yes stop_codon:yes gene_type:complete
MSNELLNKAITSCFAKIARVDGSIGKEEMDIINSSEILKKYGQGDIDTIDTRNFFNKIQSEYGEVINKSLNDEEKETFIGELVSLIKSDNKVHDHEFFLLGHVANSVGYSPEKVAEIINDKGITNSKSSGWFSWLFG